MKTALIDCDGVLCDFVTPALRGTSRRTEEVKEWNFIENLLNAEERKYVKEKLASPYFWAHEIKPREDARGFGDRLQRLGYERVVIVTSPWNKEVMAARAEWLYKHFGTQFDALVFDGKKAEYAGDLLIDDGLHNLDSWSLRQGSLQQNAICMAAPYNVGWNPRIDDWTQLDEVLKARAA